MDKQPDKIINQIDSSRPSLPKEKKEVLWSAIASETINKQPVLSPYTWLSTFKKPLMAPAVLAIVVMLGTTGLVAASEPTRPGDTLFAVKQASENIRLALASDDAKTRLEAEFAAERLIELSSILEESLAEYRKNNVTSSLKAEDEKRVNEALGITLSYFGKTNLSSTTKDNLYTELASLLEGAPIRIDDEKLKSYKNDAEIEIREEKDDRRIEIKDGENRLRIREKDGELRIEYNDTWGDDYEGDRDDNDENEGMSKDEDEDSNEELNETRYDDSRKYINERTYIKYEDEVEVETKDREDNDDKDDDVDGNKDESDRDNSNQSDNDEDVEIRIEVRVEDGEAEVRVDGESDSEFTLPYTTKALLISAIALKTGLSEAVTNSNLDLEIKD